MPFTPPPGATLNEQGYYVDANGNLSPGQTTPGMIGADKMGLTPQYDAKKGLWYTNPIVNGKQTGANYISPVVMAGPDGKPQPFKDSGGGMVNHPSWNNKTGQWDQGLNWGNIMSMVIAGTLTMGAASALMGGGEAAQAALETYVPGSGIPGASLGMTAPLPGAIDSIAMPAALTGTGTASLPQLASNAPKLEGIGTGPGSTSVPTPQLGPPIPDTPPVVPPTEPPVVPAGESVAPPTTDAFPDPTGAPPSPTPPAAPTPPGVSTTEGSEFAGPGENGAQGGVHNGLLGNQAPDSSVTKISSLLDAGSKLFGNTAQANANNQLNGAYVGAQVNNSNNTGESLYQNELMAREKAEQGERHSALQDIYRQSYASNPRASNYNVSGPPKYSQAYLDALSGLSAQGTSLLSKPATYGTTAQPPITPPTRIDPQPLTNPGGTLSQVSKYVTPGLSALGTIGKIAGWWM